MAGQGQVRSARRFATRALRVGPVAAMLGVLALTAPIVAPAAHAEDTALPGTITEFPLGAVSPWGIVTGPDGAIWVTLSSADGRVVRMTTAGQITNTFNSPEHFANFITVGADGNLWLTSHSVKPIAFANAVVRMTPQGTATAFQLTTPDSQPEGIVSGPDGKLWIAQQNANQIASIDPTAPDPSKTITEYPLTKGSGPFTVTVGPDGLVWFTEQQGDRIGHLDPRAADVKSSIVELDLPTGENNPVTITSGPDGHLWFTVANSQFRPRIDFVTTRGTFGGYDLPPFTLPPHPDGAPLGLAPGPDGALWFTMGDEVAAIGRITTAGEITTRLLPGFANTAVIAPGPDGTLWFAGERPGKGQVVRISDITGLTEPPPTTAPPTTQPPTTSAPPTTQPPPTHPPGATPAQAIVGTPKFTG